MLFKKFLPAVFMLLAMIFAASGCSGSGGAVKTAGTVGSDKVQVYTTIFPAYDFAGKVGGDRVEVHSIMPAGADPHHWEPTPGDIVKIGGSDVFIYCGAGLETWVDNILKSGVREGMVVVDCSRGIELLQGGHEDPADVGSAESTEGHDHGSAKTDPHIWLDPVNASIMVDNILEGLIKADPAGSGYYTANAANYKARLAELDGRYRSELAGVSIKKFVVSHAAFGYLARRYGLEQVPVRGLTGESEPSPARMAEIVDVVRREGIKYIFFEPTASPRVTEAIAGETGAGTLVLNPISVLTDKEMEEGKDYISFMEENLAALKTACETR
ncbi:MAG: metal ABC transporter substrate-binding protein [Bacillota bacterium]